MLNDEMLALLMKTSKPFTNAEYLSLLRATHPDSTSPEYRHVAFLLLKEKEALLRPEERKAPQYPMEGDKPLRGQSLPKSLAELLAQRAEFEARKAEARARKKAAKST
jgi:tryptophan 2,3-dioxygenase